MYLRNLWFGRKFPWSITVSLMLVVTLGLAVSSLAKKGQGGGGKPPKDDPVPTNPVIAMWGFYKGARERVMVMEKDGTNWQVVVDDSDGFIKVRFPAWSPDGDRIAFFGAHAELGPGYYIVEMEMDESGWTGNWLGPELLVEEEGTNWATKPDWNPIFGPEQHRIAFSKLDPPFVGHGDIFIVDFTMDNGVIIGETKEVNLTGSGGVHEQYPTWSPDGERLAFIKGSYPFADIVIYDVNNGGPSLIVEFPDGSPLKDVHPSGVAWAREHNLLAVEAEQDIWCVDLNVNPVSVFNLTKNFDPSEDGNFGGASWTAGDTGIAYTGGGSNTIYVLEFVLPGGRCPTDAVEYRSSATRRLMTDKRFGSPEWWRGALCGNGVLGGAEQCDDGNNDDGDGCSAICMLEP